MSRRRALAASALSPGERAAFMAWLATGRNRHHDPTLANRARGKLGLMGMNAIECLPIVIREYPDLIDERTAIGRVLRALVCKEAS